MTEVIFVGLPGPTHHYGGLSADNVASASNRGSPSAPKLAALQALELVRLLMRLGIVVGILPPQLRPHVPLLRTQFSGSDEEVIAQAAQKPELLEKASSSSAMWTANAATVTCAPDAEDRKLHITPANLFTNLHRRIEAQDMHRLLAHIFTSVPECIVHLPLADNLRDEGAANHMRLALTHAAPGLNVFVYGTDTLPPDPPSARQTLSASQEIARLHQVRDTLFVRQNPQLIRAGVFHNDVIAVANENFLLVHESAYSGGRGDIERMAAGMAVRIVTETELSVAEAVGSYFFNSQIVTRPDGTMAVIAPAEVQTLYNGKAARLMENIRADDANSVSEIHYIDLRQSMQNGGGPACLRLRVPMTGVQLAAMRNNVNVLADEKLLAGIESMIEKHYPAELLPSQLADPARYQGCRALLAELGQVMNLPLLG